MRGISTPKCKMELKLKIVDDISYELYEHNWTKFTENPVILDPEEQFLQPFIERLEEEGSFPTNKRNEDEISSVLAVENSALQYAAIQNRSIGEQRVGNCQSFAKCGNFSKVIMLGKREVVQRLCFEKNQSLNLHEIQQGDRASVLLHFPLDLLFETEEVIRNFTFQSFSVNIEPYSDAGLEQFGVYLNELQMITETVAEGVRRENLDILQTHLLWTSYGFSDGRYCAIPGIPEKEWIRSRGVGYCFIVTLTRYEDKWVYSIPGGKRKVGESPWECAKRECEEETGIDLSQMEDKRIYHHVSETDKRIGSNDYVVEMLT